MTIAATGGEGAGPGGDLDLRTIGQALRRNKFWIVGATLAVAMITTAAVNVVTPRYKSEARILFDGRESVFLRPEAERAVTERGAADQEALASQVQLVLSRELAVQVIADLSLATKPEFDPLIEGLSWPKKAAVMLGVSRDPYRMSVEERVLDAYYDRLTAYAVDRSRVIAIDFQSSDPALAAQVADTIGQTYLKLQQDAKQAEMQAASRWLSTEIESLRRKVADAEARVEEFRSSSDLFVGAGTTTLSNQQLGEFASQLAAARAQRSDAETRARLIREMLQRGDMIEASDVVNSEMLRRLSEQRAAFRAQLAEQSSTLLDAHPRIKELKAQVTDLDRQIRAEAEKLVRTLENDARIAKARVDALGTHLDALKRRAAVTNEDDVRLRALERDAKSQRDLLESYLARYRETSARETIGQAPADARVISRAVVSNTPFYPKKVPTVLIATLATLLTAIGAVVSGELMRATAAREATVPLSTSTALTVTTTQSEQAPHPLATLRGQFAFAPGADAPSAPTSTEGALVTFEDHARRAQPQADVSRTAFTIDDVVERLERSTSGRRIAVFGATAQTRTDAAALAVARLLSRNGLVVLVRLAPDAGADEHADGSETPPGLGEMIRGEATFGEIILRDDLSRAHLVPRGDGALTVAAIVGSMRFVTMIDALTRTYDHVVIDVGVCEDVAVEKIAALAPAAVLLGADGSAPGAKLAKAKLTACGYEDVIMLVGAPNVNARTQAA